MPKQLLFIIAFLIPLGAFTQNDIPKNISRSDLGIYEQQKKRNTGIYMAIMSAYTAIDSQDAFMFGCKGGWILGEHFITGIGGSFYMNGSRTNPLFGGYLYDFNTEGVYGYVFSEIVFSPKKKIHLNIPLAVGIGAASYVSDYYDSATDQWMYSTIGSDNHFLIEPGVEAEIVVSPYARIGIGMQYRFTSELNIKAIDIYNKERLAIPSNAIQSLSIVLSFKLGLYNSSF